MKAKLWAQCAGKSVDAVVEALVGKLSVCMVGWQQGVDNGPNFLLFAAFILCSPSHANDGKEEEDNYSEQSKVGGGRHFHFLEAPGRPVQ